VLGTVLAISGVNYDRWVIGANRWCSTRLQQLGGLQVQGNENVLLGNDGNLLLLLPAQERASREVLDDQSCQGTIRHEFHEMRELLVNAQCIVIKMNNQTVHTRTLV
jgi:hypothetical protein